MVKNYRKMMKKKKRKKKMKKKKRKKKIKKKNYYSFNKYKRIIEMEKNDITYKIILYFRNIYYLKFKLLYVITYIIYHLYNTILK